ncbi:MAG: iron-siderophore ABC transporter substrate-binding protein [Dehalococcoidia bacterium]
MASQRYPHVNGRGQPGGGGLTRRGLLAGTIGAMLLAACGDGAGSDEISSVAAPQETATTGFPITVSHRYGETTVPSAPRRVLSLSYTDHDVLLALGMVPVGIQQWFPDLTTGVGPWATDRLGGAKPELFLGAEIDIEQAAELAPDLITVIQRDLTEEVYSRLSQIAPTIAAPEGFLPFGVPWKDQALLLGRALGKEDEIARVVAGVDAKFADARQQHPAFAGKTVVVGLAGNEAQLFAYAKQDARIRFMEALGFTLAPAIDALERERFYATISREQIRLLDADVLIWLSATPAAFEPLKSDALLQQLDVAKRGDVIYVANGDLVKAFSSSTVLSLPYAIDTFLPQLASVVS